MGATMTVFFTIFAGVSIFVIGQILLKMILEPIQELKKAIGDIEYNLVEYAQVYANPKPPDHEHQTEMSRRMRALASNLNARMCVVPAYDKIGALFGLPMQQNVVLARRELIALSNGFDGCLENQGILNCYSAQRVRDALGIHIPDIERLDPERERTFIKAKSLIP